MAGRKRWILACVAALLVACGKARPMDEARFWSIIEATGSPYDPVAKENALRLSLARLTAPDLIEFNRIYHEKTRRAYTWDLWAAGFIIGKGCSDDGFLEFRNFVIGHGRAIYEAAVANPDSLAEKLGTIPEQRGMRLPYLPESDMIPTEIYEEQTGEEMPFEMSGGKEPSGARWKEGRADLSRICPKLWARFGGDWIQTFERDR